MSEDPRVDRRRLPFVITATAVLVVGAIAAAIAINNANGNVPVGTATPTPAPTATPAPTPTPTPVSGQIAFADCTTATFGAALAPLSPPATVHKYSAAPAMTIDQTKLYEATITTAKGKIVICLQPALAPITVNSFVTLARNQFYDGIPFHRVGPDASTPAVAQGGDPNCIGNPSGPTCGQGGPGYQFADEPVKQQYVAGTIAMANSGPNTNGSQFFIDKALQSFPVTNGIAYNLFGKVATGLDVVNAIVKGDVMTSVTVAVQQ